MAKLSEKLANSTLLERGMSINEGDPLEETDYIAYYDSSDTSILFGAMVKTILSEQAPSINDSALTQNNLILSQLENVKGKFHIIKKLYYFGINNNFVVTNLSGSSKINSFMAYIDWLLKPKRVYNVTPILVKQEIENLKDVKGLRFSTQSFTNKKNSKSDKNKEQTIKKEIPQEWMPLLKTLFKKDAPTHLKEILEENMVRMEILLKFAAKNVNDKEKSDTFRNLLLNIEDSERVSFETRQGIKTLGDVERKEHVIIDTTETGLLSEKTLCLEMKNFLQKLEDELVK